ncbi:hypothetical protein DL765_007116 [Monosporascus sp. GIB2]|nr:hypothetical protein DL765_007116 [Monosporascus sp. GIB2]
MSLLTLIILNFSNEKAEFGRRQEAARFTGFTPKAVNWYFDTREDYSWIKPKNTVNVDKGGIMAGMGNPNGWIDNGIAVEWLKRVYLPQTKPEDEVEARLIILDGHKSHTPVCIVEKYLHTSHGIQPLDNGKFNLGKKEYRAELNRLNSLDDSSPSDKNSSCGAMTKHALRHAEIQGDKATGRDKTSEPSGCEGEPGTPTNSRQTGDLAVGRSPRSRNALRNISKAFETKEAESAIMKRRVEELEARLEVLERPRKRRAIPNPNKRFTTISEALAKGEDISNNVPAFDRAQQQVVMVEESAPEEESSVEEGGEDE